MWWIMDQFYWNVRLKSTYLFVGALMLDEVAVHLKYPPTQFALKRILMLGLRKTAIIVQVLAKITLWKLTEVKITV